jgi:3-hydroxybutyryl-CoA dehydrogenase
MAEIKTVVVIGAGSVGRGVAHVAALGGYRTILEDILPASLRRAGSEIRGYLDHAIGLGRVSRADAEAALQRLEYAGTVEEAARQADLVIESVPEEPESKREIFILLDKICRPHTILAANTRSLSVSEIASVTYRPHKVAGMRFIHPVHAMTRLELARGQATDDETVAACAEVGRRMGMEVVVIEEGRAPHHQQDSAT